MPPQSEEHRTTRIIVGVAVGQRPEPSAICVTEIEDRDQNQGGETHYVVRLLQRLPAGTPYPAVADRVTAVAEGLALQAHTPEVLYLDATGRGEPLVDLFRDRLRHLPGPSVVPVYLNPGDRAAHDFREIQLGKALIVTTLQTFLQRGRLHLPETPEARVLGDELANYELRGDESASDRLFRVGPHDDMVTALGLVTQKGWPRAEVW